MDEKRFRSVLEDALRRKSGQAPTGVGLQQQAMLRVRRRRFRKLGATYALVGASVAAIVVVPWVALVALDTPDDGSQKAEPSSRDSQCTIQKRGSRSPAWLAAPGAQRANTAIQRSIDQRFGEDGKAVPVRRLSNGLIGVAFDDYEKEIVVVVDPQRVDRLALQQDLVEVARKEDVGDAGVADLAVRVQAGCFGAAELLSAREVIDSRNWHPDVGSATYTVGLDAYTSTFRVTFRPEDEEVAKALKAKLRDRVTITYDNSLGRD